MRMPLPEFIPIKSTTLLCLVAACLSVTGCATQTINRTETQSYRVGQRVEAAPGGLLLSAQSGEIRTIRRWVGVLYSSDGWQTTTAHDSNFLRKELLYSGISGTTIEIGYREFRGGYAAPAFYQSAKYDLSVSREISFQNFRLRVETADNNGMTGVLLSDGKTSAQHLVAPASDPATTLKDAAQAEKHARQIACHDRPAVSLVSRSIGQETYAVPCRNGETLMIRCDLGNCRTLQ